MNSKERIRVALEGGKPDRVPFTCFFNCDYKAKLAGISDYEFLFGTTEHRIRAMEATLLRHDEDWIMCEPGISRTWANQHRLVMQPRPMIEHIETGKREPIRADLTLPSEEWGSEFLPGGDFGYSFARVEGDRSSVKTPADARKAISVLTADELIAEGYLAPQVHFVEHWGKQKFICAWAGNLLFNALYFFGTLEEGLIATSTRRALFQELVRINLAQETEFARAAARLGADGIWLAEMLASADVLSPRFYDEVVFPAEKKLIEECRRLGLKTYFYFTGDVASLLGAVERLGVDGIVFEPNDKRGHRIDVGELRKRLPRICLFGNLDPIGILLKNDPQQIEVEVRRQIEVAGKDGRFIMHSNIIPVTVPPESVDCMKAATETWGQYERGTR